MRRKAEVLYCETCEQIAMVSHAPRKNNVAETDSLPRRERRLVANASSFLRALSSLSTRDESSASTSDRLRRTVGLSVSEPVGQCINQAVCGVGVI